MADIYTFESPEKSQRETVSSHKRLVMDVGEQYSRTKKAVGFQYWSIDEGSTGLIVTLNGEPIDMVLSRKDSTARFGCVQEAIAQGLYVQLKGACEGDITLGLYDFQQSKSFKWEIGSNSVPEFCTEIMTLVNKHRQQTPRAPNRVEESNTIINTAEKKMRGTMRVPLSVCINAHPDKLIRAIDESYVARLIIQMEAALLNGRDVPLPPACGIIDVKDDLSDEDISNGGVEVTIIGGNHTLLACKRLKERFPNAKSLNYRLVNIYQNPTIDEIKTLALLANEETETLKPTADLDKIKIMRQQLTDNFNGEMSPAFLDKIHLMFNAICPDNKNEELKRKKKLFPLTRLASLNDECWELFLKLNDKHPGHGVYVYNGLSGISAGQAKYVLTEASEGRLKLPNLPKFIKELPKVDALQATQRIRKKKIDRSKQKETSRNENESATMEVFVDEGRKSKSSAFSSKENLNKFL